MKKKNVKMRKRNKNKTKNPKKKTRMQREQGLKKVLERNSLLIIESCHDDYDLFH